MADRAHPIEKSIVLVGMMGAGKTSVGRQLAARLALPFVDTDDEVERVAGIGVPAIFDRFGEEYFRGLERQVIDVLLDGFPCVIATGGGSFVDETARKRLLESCTVVWLDADVETLARRVAKEDRRPLFRGRDRKAVLADLAAQRRPFYAQAHLRVDAAPPPEQIAADLVAALRPRTSLPGRPVSRPRR